MNKELTIYERDDIQYIPKRTYNQEVMDETLQNLNVTNMAMMQNMLMQSQQQNAMMLNMINNTGYIEEEEGDFFGSIFKYLIVILFCIWLFLGFTGKSFTIYSPTSFVLLRFCSDFLKFNVSISSFN